MAEAPANDGDMSPLPRSARSAARSVNGTVPPTEKPVFEPLQADAPANRVSVPPVAAYLGHARPAPKVTPPVVMPRRRAQVAALLTELGVGAVAGALRHRRRTERHRSNEATAAAASVSSPTAAARRRRPPRGAFEAMLNGCRRMLAPSGSRAPHHRLPEAHSVVRPVAARGSDPPAAEAEASTRVGLRLEGESRTTVPQRP